MKYNKFAYTLLWKSRLSVLEIRRPSWILKTLIFPIMLMIPLYFLTNRSVQVFTSAVLFASTSLVVYILVWQVNKKRLQKRFTYNLLIILYQIYDFSFLCELSAVFWGTANNLMARSQVFDIYILQIVSIFLLLCLFGSIGLAIFLSPKLICEKIDAANKPQKSGTRILLLYNSLPALGILSGILLARSKEYSTSLLILSAVFYAISFFIFPLLAIGMYELLLISINKWLPIYKAGSKFEVEQ